MEASQRSKVVKDVKQKFSQKKLGFLLMTKKQQNSVKQLSFNLKKYIKKNDTKQNTPTRNLSAMQQTQEMWV